jgi:predicted nicotinamide N-methyase
MGTHFQDGWVLNHAAFILSNTEILSPPLVPEVKLHLAHEALPIWQKTEDELGEIGLPPPFWAFAWAGGQALARYVLDHPEIVQGLRVVDLASGSGLVGITAMQAGAASVLAADIDAFSIAAIHLNAALNQVELAVTSDDLLQTSLQDVDVILVGDLFYEKALASRCYDWLLQCRAAGAKVLIGDPGRSYLPREQLHKIVEYKVPVSRDLEDAEIKNSAVWKLKD